MMSGLKHGNVVLPGNSPAVSSLGAMRSGRALMSNNTPHFGMAESVARSVRPSAFLKAMDYTSIGETTFNQIKLIYALMISARLAAAAKRGWNDLREKLIQNSMSYSFWLFTAPVMQRGLVYLLTRKNYHKTVITETAKPEGMGLKARLARLHWSVNPLKRFSMANRNQILDARNQTLGQLMAAGHDETSAVYQQASKYFEKLVIRRDLATGIGVAITLAMLGVVMPLVNMAITRHEVAQGRVGKNRIGKNGTVQNQAGKAGQQNSAPLLNQQQVGSTSFYGANLPTAATANAMSFSPMSFSARPLSPISNSAGLMNRNA